MKSAYFHCIGGASGDMILGALLDVGLSMEALEGELAKLPVKGSSLSTAQANRGGVTGTHLSVILDEEGHRKRGWQDFLALIEGSDLSQEVKERTSAVFRRLEEAEARAHKASAQDLSPHELGTLDTLVDVVGAVAGLELLGVKRVYSSPFPSGSGIARSGHGLLPVPAPATMQLMAIAEAPIVPPPSGATDAGEMVTPTGAAIITTLASFRQPSITLERIGYGLGTRDSPHYPNVLALWIGEELAQEAEGAIILLETNIDDMSPELFGYVQERLFALGAYDVWFTPIQMKKNRPGTILSVLIRSLLETQAVETIMRETSTLGIRVRPVHRYEAQREVVQVPTNLGPVQVKVKRLEGKAISVSPEYEACRSIALERSIPLQEVLRRITREASDKLLG